MATSDDWIEEEFAWCDFGDERLVFRLKQIVRDLAAKPSASFPQACEDAAALKATYRFLDNSDVDAKEILTSHQQASLARLRAHKLVLAVQDTSFFNFTAHPETKGLGPLANSQQQGLCVHSTLAFTPERLPLGLLQQQVWAREEPTKQEGEKDPKQDHKKRALEDKESRKWLESLAAVQEIAAFCPETTFLSTGDREADVYDLLIAPRADNVHILIRACQDRCLEEAGHLKSQMQAAPIVADMGVSVPRRDKQAARQAQVSVRFQTVTLRPPKHRVAENLPNVRVSVVLVREEHPPAGCVPLSWLLITTLLLSSVEQALECVQWYCVRWQIEVWHKVLKSGCRIESRQLAHAERLERCLALYSIIAWRLMYAVMLSRSVPELSCEVLLEPAEWQALYCHVYKRPVPPSQPPTLEKAVRWIGQLGGYLARKSDGPPGVTVLWRGFQRLSDITEMYRIMRPPPLVGKD